MHALRLDVIRCLTVFTNFLLIAAAINMRQTFLVYTTNCF